MSSTVFVFNRPSFLLTCTPATFSWSSSVPAESSAQFTIDIHWVPSLQPEASPSVSAAVPTFSNGAPPPGGPNSRSIARRAPPNTEDSIIVRSFPAFTSDRSHDWPTVDIPEGVYFLSATIDSLNIVNTSETFPVYNATDISCLKPLPVPSISPGVSASLSETETGSASLTDPLPTNGALIGASRKSTNVGAIAGGVVAGVVAILLFILFTFFRRRRRQSRSKGAPSIKSTKSGKRGMGKAGEAVGNWKGLGSVDLHDPEGGVVAASIENARKESDSSEATGPPSLPYDPPSMNSRSIDEERRNSLSATRKMTRKPVPSYLGNIPPPSPFESSPEPQRKMSTSSHTLLPSSTSLVTGENYDARRSSSVMKRPLKNTYASYPKDEEEVEAEAMVANLKDKANYGDMMQMKPVHYLMPDLPLSERQHVNRR